MSEFPALSTATKVTVDRPSGNTEPEGRPPIWVITGVLQLSVAVGGLKKTVLSHVTIGAGQEITGEIVSTKPTLKKQNELFPLASVPIKSTVCVVLKTRPGAGL